MAAAQDYCSMLFAHHASYFVSLAAAILFNTKDSITSKCESSPASLINCCCCCYCCWCWCWCFSNLPSHVASLCLHQQVKVALCQLHVTADKDQNISSARAAIQASVWLPDTVKKQHTMHCQRNALPQNALHLNGLEQHQMA